MKDKGKSLCIIPARGGSKRFPRKNIALLNGKPLLGYAIEATIESKQFDTIHVSSEDDEILKIADTYPGIDAVPRDNNLATDTATIVQLTTAILENYEAEGVHFNSFCILLTTSPLRKSSDIQEAFQLLKSRDCNAVMSVVQFDHAPQTSVYMPEGYIQFYLGDEHRGLRQEIPELYRHDGSIYYAKTDHFLAGPTQFGEKVLPLVIPPERSVDIDHPLDLDWAEFLIRKYKIRLP